MVKALTQMQYARRVNFSYRPRFITVRSHWLMHCARSGHKIEFRSLRQTFSGASDVAKRGRRGATLQEIAQEIGVSVATVSRVARGVGQVSEDTRRRVLAAIERHDFRPSRLGSALAKRSHGALGIVFPGLSGPYYSEVI